MNRSNNLRTTIESYGDYSNSNYGTHTMKVTLENGDLLYYSYRTLIAFTHNNELFICENIWGSTTGKHLNFIDRDKKRRLKSEEFESKFDQLHNSVKLEVA